MKRASMKAQLKRIECIDEMYRIPDYSDIPVPIEPDWEKLYAGYFEDAHEGLGMPVQRARLYAERHIEDDKYDYAEELAAYKAQLNVRGVKKQPGVRMRGRK